MRTKSYFVCIDPVQACPVQCPECATGRREFKASGTKLQPDQLQRILDAIVAQVPIKGVFLFAIGEPTLHPELGSLVRVARRFAPVTISTTGTGCRCDLQDLADSGLDEMWISFKGWNVKTSLINMPGSDFEAEREFVYRTNGLGFKRRTLLYHRYNNNLDQEDAARWFARDNGMHFMGNWAFRLNLQDVMADREFPNLIATAAEVRAILNRGKARFCDLGFQSFYMEHNGDVRLCGVANTLLKAGNIFQDTVESIIETRRCSSLCAKCVASKSSRAPCEMPLAVDWLCMRKSPFKWYYYPELIWKFLYRVKEGRL